MERRPPARRNLVIGDIHGARRALEQALYRASYQPKFDTLIFLGDLVDGWPESRGVLDFIRGVPNKLLIRGNHDKWFRDFLAAAIDNMFDYKDELAAASFNTTWWTQGGRATYKSYDWEDRDTIVAHFELLEEQKPIAVIPVFQSMFVHGGWDKDIGVDATLHTNPSKLYWDRDIWRSACMNEHYARRGHQKRKPRDNRFVKIFIGHSDVRYAAGYFEEAAECKPVRATNLINLDTGAGYDGKLTVMDMMSMEYSQSDFVPELYPNSSGRGKFDAMYALGQGKLRKQTF